jgi:hypothetical protein
MTTLNCHVPLTLRVRGEPSAVDWAALEDALTVRYTAALRRGLAELSRRPMAPPAADEPVRERLDPQREWWSVDS